MILNWFKKKDDPSRPKTAGIHPLLDEDLIVIAPSGLDKDGLIDFLLRRLCKKRSLGSPDPFLAKVLERERGISTTLDTGLAVPHARIDGLENTAAILGLAPKGMPDPKQPDMIIRAMFLFFSPNRQEAFAQHLQLLREVSALFQPAFIDDILRHPSGAEALKLIRSKEDALG